MSNGMISKIFLNAYVFMSAQCQCVLTPPSELSLWGSTLHKVPRLEMPQRRHSCLSHSAFPLKSDMNMNA